MSDFVRGDCHKCKYEITAECVPHSQRMGWPKCYQSIVTNADRIRAMTDEELAELLTTVAKHSADKLCESLKPVDIDLSNCDFNILNKAHLSWLKQPVKEYE